MSDSSNTPENKEKWKSLQDYKNDPEIVKLKQNEFLDNVTEEFTPSSLSGISRRKFLALLAASSALTATACTDYHDKGEIIPYNKRPEEVLPGVANYYASTCSGCGLACGILIKTREGRPVKVDGNPDHPVNKGKICAKGQADILSLYDPERLRQPMKFRKEISWKRADEEITGLLKEAQDDGKEIVVITGAVNSPTTKKVLDDFAAKFPNSKVYSHSLINDDARREAWLQCYGSRDYPSINFESANVILALDSDFLGNEGSYIENMRKYAAKREVVGKTDFNRLYVAEGRMSATGMMADYRMRISPDRQLEFIYGLISELRKINPSGPTDQPVVSGIPGGSITEFGEKEKISHLLKDLIDNRGTSIIYAGDTLSKEVHIAVNLLNEILGNTKLYDYSSVSKSLVRQSSASEISKLVESMNKGNVGVVIHFDSNPVYTLPSDHGYQAA
ncbi:MAG: TAT-variant-translocated molybdopterin oxidoreductase, partial [Melioribacteraceae bacterium]